MAKRKRAQQTPNQREYAKQLQRIKNAVKRAEKRGYTFDSNVIPQTPKRITKSAIQRLKEITTPKLYAQAQYIVPETGKTVSGTEGRKIERKKSAQKAKQTRQKKKSPRTDLFDYQYDESHVVYDYGGDTYLPDGGKMSYDTVYELYVSQWVDELSQPTDEVWYDPYRGNKRKKWSATVDAINRSKTTLLSLVNAIIAREGKSQLGWRLQNNADVVADLTNYMLYAASNADGVEASCQELATIINGGALSMQQLQDLGEQNEYNSSWGNP